MPLLPLLARCVSDRSGSRLLSSATSRGLELYHPRVQGASLVGPDKVGFARVCIVGQPRFCFLRRERRSCMMSMVIPVARHTSIMSHFKPEGSRCKHPRGVRRFAVHVVTSVTVSRPQLFFPVRWCDIGVAPAETPAVAPRPDRQAAQADQRQRQAGEP